jgi:enterochelin esterase-like enzyme
MRSILMAAALLFQFSACQALGGTQRADGAVEATLGSTQQFDFHSAINGEDYRVQIFIPRKAPPAGGYPVLYVLDGDALFGTFAEAVRNRSQAGEIDAAIVVGISGGPGEHTADRTFDFTPSDLSAKERTLVKEFGPDSKFGVTNSSSELFKRRLSRECPQ